MMFMFVGIDRSDGAATRAAVHDAHAEYQRARSNPVGGPLLADDGSSAGTLILFEAENLAAAQSAVDDDPFVKAGLFATIELRPFRVVDWPS